MPKKRKTRKQKILVDQKRQVVQEVRPSMESSQKNEKPLTPAPTVMQKMTFSLPTNYNTTPTVKKEKEPIASVVISTSEYGYIGTDLMRTALLSAAIVMAEILIRLFYLH